MTYTVVCLLVFMCNALYYIWCTSISRRAVLDMVGLRPVQDKSSFFIRKQVSFSDVIESVTKIGGTLCEAIECHDEVERSFRYFYQY